MTKMTLVRLFLVLPAFLVLWACSDKPDEAEKSGAISNSASQSGLQAFVDRDYGIRITYPKRLDLRDGFERNYLSSDRWKAYANPNAAAGKAIVALILPGSNQVTAGELHIGVSRQAKALANCTALPDAAVSGSRRQVTISGIPFVTFKARSAGMSHYMIVRSYRTVKNQTCYAVDIVVTGTNPAVYEPPRTAPFTKVEVFKRLKPVVHHLRLFDTTSLSASEVTM